MDFSVNALAEVTKDHNNHEYMNEGGHGQTVIWTDYGEKALTFGEKSKDYKIA